MLGTCERLTFNFEYGCWLIHFLVHRTRLVILVLRGRHVRAFLAKHVTSVGGSQKRKLPEGNGCVSGPAAIAQAACSNSIAHRC